MAINATLRAEAEALAPVLSRALEPLGDEGVAIILGQEISTYGLNYRDKTPEEWTLFWTPYRRVLSGFSAANLEAAFHGWQTVTDAMSAKEKAARRFYPLPVDLHALALTHRNHLGLMAGRVRKALDHREAQPVVRERMTRAQMIERGYLDENGRVPGLGGGALGAVLGSAFVASAADQQASDQRARHSGVPISRSHLAPPAEEEGI